MVFYAAAVFLGGQKTKLFKFEDKAPDGGIGDMAVISILTKGDEQCGGIVLLYQQPRPKSKAWVWVTTPELFAFWGLFCGFPRDAIKGHSGTKAGEHSLYAAKRRLKWETKMARNSAAVGL